MKRGADKNNNEFKANTKDYWNNRKINKDAAFTKPVMNDNQITKGRSAKKII